MDNAYATNLMNEIAVFAHKALFWYTPYDTGNLARSIGTVGGEINRAYFEPFNSSKHSGNRAGYGAILNEAPQITVRRRCLQTGALYNSSYANKHYKWLDKAADGIAAQLTLNFDVRRIT